MKWIFHHQEHICFQREWKLRVDLETQSSYFWSLTLTLLQIIFLGIVDFVVFVIVLLQPSSCWSLSLTLVVIWLPKYEFPSLTKSAISAATGPLFLTEFQVSS